ncbi:MAG: sugar nucleotide-binding protein, partial [Pseudomonadota bacterium]|nr:sugar nucleotide-binding protein [Pseudomonadota bacterium]
NRGAVSWYDFALMAARAAGLDPAGVRPVTGAALGQVAPRPPQAALDSRRGRVMPTLEHSLARYIAERGPDVLPQPERAPADHRSEQRVA